MTLKDIPGFVDIPNRWPLGLILAAVVGLTVYTVNLENRVSRGEERIMALEGEKRQLVLNLAEVNSRREVEGRGFDGRLTRLETQIGLALDLLREIRDGVSRRP